MSFLDKKSLKNSINVDENLPAQDSFLSKGKKDSINGANLSTLRLQDRVHRSQSSQRPMQKLKVQNKPGFESVNHKKHNNTILSQPRFEGINGNIENTDDIDDFFSDGNTGATREVYKVSR